jgi:APA family basic amino acid/polyamine antiporter
LPTLGIFACLGLMASLPWETWLRLVIWLAVGMAVYLLYGHRNARRLRGKND